MQIWRVKELFVPGIVASTFKEAGLRAVCTRAQVKRLKESRLTIRGNGDQNHIASEDVKTRPVI